jgi:hypothetical protein
MKIVVFTDHQPNSGDNALIAKFENQGYRVLVDSLHKQEIPWIKENYGETPHRVYYAESTELYDGIVGELDENAPFNFIAYFDQTEKLNNADWVYIRLFLKAFLYDTKMPRLTRRITNLLSGQHVEVKVAADSIPLVDEGSKETEGCYTFNKAVFEDRNIALCEIVKPIIVRLKDKNEEKVLVESSIPYTVVIRNFADRGYYPLFWSLFVCESWGKDNKDIQFLQALWGSLDMEGAFDMDAILDQGMKECNWSSENGACAGPEVYRKSLKDTLEKLLVKEKGFGRYQ